MSNHTSMLINPLAEGINRFSYKYTCLDNFGGVIEALVVWLVFLQLYVFLLHSVWYY